MSPRARRSDAAPAAMAALSRLAIEAGSQLRDLRIGRRWTLRQLSERAGVSVATAQAAEAGRPVSLETHARLSATLGSRPTISFDARHAKSRPLAA